MTEKKKTETVAVSSSTPPDVPTLLMRPLSWFRPYERNPREFTVDALKQFAAAIKRFGFRYPILARSSGEVVDGHFRLAAGEVAGLTQVPMMLADDMTEADVRAFRLSVNRMAELADWQQDNLLHELEALRDAGEPLDLDGPVRFELEDFDAPLEVAGWDFALVKDRSVITITSPKPLEAEVRARLKGLDGCTIEVSTLEID